MEPRSIGVQGDEAVGIREGQGTEKDAVDHGEQRTVRADAQGESENGDDGEVGGLGERADGVTNVLQ
jgi:hypothetical protein